MDDVTYREFLRRKAHGICPICGQDPDRNAFKDQLSIDEFMITGVCQSCQDELDTHSKELEKEHEYNG